MEFSVSGLWALGGQRLQVPTFQLRAQLLGPPAHEYMHAGMCSSGASTTGPQSNLPCGGLHQPPRKGVPAPLCMLLLSLGVRPLPSEVPVCVSSVVGPGTRGSSPESTSVRPQIRQPVSSHVLYLFF